MGKPDLSNKDHGSMHLAEESRWRKPSLEMDEDRGTSPAGGSRKGKLELDNGDCEVHFRQISRY
jgi:hypothetical protein